LSRITFTEHAFDRVKERLHLSHKEAAKIINNDQAIPIGFENRTNRKHLLFYSIPDECCFVIVFDVKTREVITILPTNWHNRWVVSPEAEVDAKKLILYGEQPGSFLESRNSINTAVFKVFGIFERINGKF